MPRNRLVAFHTPPPMPLGCSIGGMAAVDESMDPDLSWPERVLDRLTLFLTVSGSATFSVAGHEVEVRPGSLLALARGAPFIERTPDRGWWHVRYLMLEGPVVEPLQAVLDRHPSRMGVHHDAPRDWSAALTRCVHLALHETPGWPLAFLHHLTGLLHALGQSPAPLDEPGIMDRVARAVDRSPGEPWSVARMAAVVRMGSSAFAHRFTAAAGLSPAAWVRQRRLDRAALLLAEGLSVTAVAEQLGFSDAFHLSRLYRARFGQPPTRHRRGLASPLHHAE